MNGASMALGFVRRAVEYKGKGEGDAYVDNQRRAELRLERIDEQFRMAVEQAVHGVAAVLVHRRYHQQPHARSGHSYE